MGDASFGTDPVGLRALLDWLHGFGVLTVVGVEGTGTYGAELTRLLRLSAGRRVQACRPAASRHRPAGRPGSGGARPPCGTSPGRILDLDTELRALDAQLAELVATAAPRTTALLGSPPTTLASC